MIDLDPQRPILVHNTLSRRKEELVPIEPGKLRIYVCGVTVYSSSHIGHARSGVTFDVVLRYLLWRGYEVTFVKNFTDVDDKIIKRAGEEGVDASVISERYIAEFYADMDALYILRPDLEPRVTGFMPQIIRMIEQLVARGHAYIVDGDVFYDISTKSDYGKLSGRTLDEQEEGARVEVDSRKRHPFDFALWKSAKPGEPAWESPWGAGRPGWHIECSAMGQALLGDTFDIHGGGNDLIFPHHENEIAQTEGATGVVPCVRYWMHNGMLTIDAEKMSKSLDNFFTIQEVLGRYHPESLRLFFLSSHYRSPADFSEAAISESEQRLERLYGALDHLDRHLGGAVSRPHPAPGTGWRREHLYTGAPGGDPLGRIDADHLQGRERGIFAEVQDLLPRMALAMDDDFNTAKAIGHVFELVRKLNRWLDSSPEMSRAEIRALVEGARDRLLMAGSILGIFNETATDLFADLRRRRLAFVGMHEAEIEKAIGERNQARADRDFARSDEIRDRLAGRGIALKDSPAGTTWEVVRPIGIGTEPPAAG